MRYQRTRSPFFHDQSRQVAKYITVDRMKHARVFTSEFVEDHERGDELAVDILRRAVRCGFAFGCDDNRAQKTGIRFAWLIRVGVIPPYDRRGLRLPWTAAFVREPMISKTTTGHDARTRSEGQIRGSFTCLVISESVRMNAVWQPTTIKKLDFDRITNFCTDNRP